MKVNLLIVPFLLIALIPMSCSIKGDENPNSSASLTVPVYDLITLDTVVFSDYIADIQAIKNVEIRSRVRGFLKTIHVDEGSFVHRNQILFTLDKDEYRAEVARAEAALQNAIADAKTVSLEAERTKLLVDKNIISTTDLDVATAQVSAAESRVEEARSILQNTKTRLSYTDIRAPFDGRIDRIPLKEGSLLDEGTLLTSVSDLSSVYAYFDISEREYLNIFLNSELADSAFERKVGLTLANGEVFPHQGKAEFAESEFEANTGSISLRARFDNPTGLLKHGSSGRVNVPIQTGDIQVVHQKSVFEIQDRTYVYILNQDSTVNMIPFDAGQRVGHFYLVNAGLDPDATIVFEGVQSLRDGVKVNFEAVDPLGK